MAVFGFALPLLLVTTQARDLMLVLVDKLKFPYEYALMFITSLRFIPNLFMEIETILQAQRCRAFELKTKNPVKQVKAYFPLITPLVLISLKKAQRLAVAMETRGFGGGKRTYLHQIDFKKVDWVICGTMSALAVAGLILKVKGIIN
jgi:energy-coupling factor transport system permease protein